MIEVMLCSLVTILPDFLVRRYLQGKRWGAELNFFSMWYELRVGITACLILTVSLITTIFYFHPSTTNVSSFFRTVTILPETGGRVTEVYVRNNQTVAAGQLLFSLDSTTEEAAAKAASGQMEQIEAALAVAQFDLEATNSTVEQAAASYKQTQEELARKQTLFRRNSAAVSRSEVERLTNLIASRKAALNAANSARSAIEAKINTLLPSQMATAAATFEQVSAQLAKKKVYAGVAGTVQQFTLRAGDIVSPVLRPAGILVPSDAGRGRFQAGFGQISTQVIKVGMVAEITCVSKPFTIIPMVVTEVQEVISAGQVRPSDQLLDMQDRARPGSITVYMEPLYLGQTDTLPPGSKCIANAYTSNHDKLDDENLSTSQYLFYHMVDTVALVHAFILRLQAIQLPVKTLVLSGH